MYTCTFIFIHVIAKLLNRHARTYNVGNPTLYVNASTPTHRQHTQHTPTPTHIPTNRPLYERVGGIVHRRCRCMCTYVHVWVRVSACVRALISVSIHESAPMHKHPRTIQTTPQLHKHTRACVLTHPRQEPKCVGAGVAPSPDRRAAADPTKSSSRTLPPRCPIRQGCLNPLRSCWPPPYPFRPV